MWQIQTQSNTGDTDSAQKRMLQPIRRSELGPLSVHAHGQRAIQLHILQIIRYRPYSRQPSNDSH